MILSSLITISDWLPLAKQKSTYNFEIEMLVNILLKFENLITIVEKRKRLLTEFKCRSYYEVDCFLSILVTSPDEEFWSRKQPLPRIYVKGSSPPNNTVLEDIRECISMTIFVKLWRILAIFRRTSDLSIDNFRLVVFVNKDRTMSQSRKS